MFLAACYNIFARSLGSSCIPWVISIEDSWREVLEDRGDITWERLRSILQKEYLKHFHKNHYCGDKNGMRRIWSDHIVSAEDIPRHMASHIQYIGEDKIGYFVEGNLTTAVTLHGLLVQNLSDMGEALYQHIQRNEEHFLWEHRGPKIYQQVAGISLEFQKSPDIVVLTEYDIHDGSSMYRREGLMETFPQAMYEDGYSGALMLAPLDVETSGLGVYWKRSEFKLHSDDKEELVSFAPFTNNEVFSLKPDKYYRGTYNFDLHEHAHKLHTDPDGVKRSVFEELPCKDRKNVFFVRLQHIQSEKIVLVVGAHLMTDSRDCSGTNEFPGEVRGGELQTIGNILRGNPDITSGVDAMLMMGDFNIDVSERDILKGKVESCINGSVKHIDTNIYDDSDSGLPLYFDFNDKRSESYYNTLCLSEAFSGTHCWGENIGSGKLCSSFNSKRCSWIDMVWHSTSSLVPIKTCEIEALSKEIPDEKHGSDHLPLYVLFGFK